jgi:hypothetical protein
VKIGIVAHTLRMDRACRLAQRVRADFISWDDGDGSVGPRENHLRCWDRLSGIAVGGEWCVVLEDDAEPCPNFMTQLSNVIAWCPEHFKVISLYMGRMHPSQWQDRMGQAIALADSQRACWIRSPKCIHAVGLAMRRDDVDAMLGTARTIKGHPRPIDETISQWCYLSNHQVGYCLPSIVNHADIPTLISHPDGIVRQKGRVAWRFGGRERWSTKSVPLDPNHL